MINTIFIKVKKLKLFFNILYFDFGNDCSDLTILYYNVLIYLSNYFEKLKTNKYNN